MGISNPAAAAPNLAVISMVSKHDLSWLLQQGPSFPPQHQGTQTCPTQDVTCLFHI